MLHKDVLKLLFPVEMGGVFDQDISVEGKHLDDARAAAQALLLEMHPDTITQTLADWERVYGLSAEADINIIEPIRNLLSANQATIETDLTGLGVSGGTLERSTEKAWQGNASAKMVTAAAGDNFLALPGPHLIAGAWPTWAITFGETKSFSAHVFLDAGVEAHLLLIEIDAAGAVLGASVSDLIFTSGEWVRLICPGFTPAHPTCDGVLLRVVNGVNTFGTLYIDALQWEDGAVCSSWQDPTDGSVPDLMPESTLKPDYQRKQNILDKMRIRPNLSIPFLRSIIRSFVGYDVEIVEYTVFRCDDPNSLTDFGSYAGDEVEIFQILVKLDNAQVTTSGYSLDELRSAILAALPPHMGLTIDKGVAGFFCDDQYSLTDLTILAL